MKYDTAYARHIRIMAALRILSPALVTPIIMQRNLPTRNQLRLNLRSMTLTLWLVLIIVEDNATRKEN